MKYLGNYKHLIKQEWISLLIETKGTPISPWKDHKESEIEDDVIIEQTTATTKDEASLFSKDGIYGNKLIMAEIFTEENLPFPLNLQELNYLLDGDWWIVKQLPGQYMPMHRDTVHNQNDNIRIWMPLIDYTEGHIFIHEGKFVKDYTAGDLWQYNNDNDLHGSVNLGLTPRFILEISKKKIPLYLGTR
jgi:hypothetical protein